MNSNNEASKLIKIIYQHLDSKTDYFYDEDKLTLSLNSRKHHRSQTFFLYPGQWLLFLDHDCELSEEIFYRIQNELNSLNHSTVYAGFYQNPEKSSLLQRTHNFICNVWLKKHLVNLKSERFLGGFFLLHSNEKLIEFAKLQSQQQLFWGAEDDILAKTLVQKYSYNIQLCPEWFVTHNTTKSFNHFVRRAFWQGWNKAKYLKDEGRNIKKSLFDGCSSLHEQETGIVVFVLLHFLILTLAEKLQAIVQWSRRVKWP